MMAADSGFPVLLLLLGCALHGVHGGLYLSKQMYWCPVRAYNWALHIPFGKCIYYNDDRAGSWDEAQATCLNRGATLLRINSEEEMTFWRNYGIMKGKDHYIGLNDKDREGQWTWASDGFSRPKPLGIHSYRPWRPGRPDGGRRENCVLMKQNGQMEDITCGSDKIWYKFICELVQKECVDKRSLGYVYDPEYNRCIRFYPLEVNRTDAQKQCKRDGTTLLQIEGRTDYLKKRYHSVNMWAGRGNACLFHTPKGLRHGNCQSLLPFACSVEYTECQLPQIPNGYWDYHGNTLPVGASATAVCNRYHTLRKPNFGTHKAFRCRRYVGLSPFHWPNCTRNVCEREGYEWHPVIDRCIRFHNGKSTWEDARNKCFGENGTLIRIQSDYESRYINRVRNFGSWTGLNKKEFEDQWSWTRDRFGSTIGNVTDAIWRDTRSPQDPNKNCSFLHPRGRLAISNCSLSRHFVCQLSPPREDCGDRGFKWDQALARCIKIFPSNMRQSWTDAEWYCQRDGGRLLRVLSPAENKDLYDNPLFDHHGFWTGLNDLAQEGRWVWSTKVVDHSEPLGSYNPLRDGGQPNGGRRENCALLIARSTLHDWPCRLKFRFACERMFTECTLPPIAHGTWVPNVASVPLGSRVKVLCDTFYILASGFTANTLDCTANGGLQPSLMPKCVPIPAGNPAMMSEAWRQTVKVEYRNQNRGTNQHSIQVCVIAVRDKEPFRRQCGPTSVHHHLQGLKGPDYSVTAYLSDGRRGMFGIYTKTMVTNRNPKPITSCTLPHVAHGQWLGHQPGGTIKPPYGATIRCDRSHVLTGVESQKMVCGEYSGLRTNLGPGTKPVCKAIPSSPPKIRVVRRSNSSLEVSWDRIPFLEHTTDDGIVTYSVDIEGMTRSLSGNRQRTTTARSFIFWSLYPETEYRISVAIVHNGSALQNHSTIQASTLSSSIHFEVRLKRSLQMYVYRVVSTRTEHYTTAMAICRTHLAGIEHYLNVGEQIQEVIDRLADIVGAEDIPIWMRDSTNAYILHGKKGTLWPVKPTTPESSPESSGRAYVMCVGNHNGQ